MLTEEIGDEAERFMAWNKSELTNYGRYFKKYFDFVSANSQNFRYFSKFSPYLGHKFGHCLASIQF